jgi:mRNA-degrading endonuclease RelE of RelBE toxin-antitoxin system
MTPAITIQESFLVSAYELPKEIAKKVFKALRNFLANPTNTGLHLEKLSGRASQLSSIRVDADYRIIFTKAGPTAIMLYVAKHDLAYRYAESLSGTIPAAAGLVVTMRSSTDEHAHPASIGATIGAATGMAGISGAFKRSGVLHRAGLPSQVLPAGEVTVDLDVVKRMVEGKYLPLARHLAKRENLPLQLLFSDVEEIIGEPLPVSARKHRAWWGNESSPFRVQAVAWMGCGWKVAEVDLTNEWVRFERR